MDTRAGVIDLVAEGGWHVRWSFFFLILLISNERISAMDSSGGLRIERSGGFLGGSTGFTGMGNATEHGGEGWW
jgi:hypothetical protein